MVAKIARTIAQAVITTSCCTKTNVLHPVRPTHLRLMTTRKNRISNVSFIFTVNVLSRCQPCHSSCETCTGSNSSQCVSCGPDHYWHDGYCIKDCPAHHYADVQQLECIECTPGCSECNKTTCISCLDDWQVNSKGRCVPHGTEKCSSGINNFLIHPCLQLIFILSQKQMPNFNYI